MLSREQISNFSLNKVILTKYKDKLVEFFLKLKKQFQMNSKANRIIYNYVKNGSISVEESKELKKISQDTLKIVGLGSLAILPAGTLLILFLINTAKKLNINILPTAFENLNENVENVEYLKSFDVVYLQKLFDEINVDVFENSLERVPISINTSKNRTGVFSYKSRVTRVMGIHGYRINSEYIYGSGKITISNKFKFTEQKLRNVMAHEMIHYWVAINAPEKGHHGYNFMRQMNRLNATGKYKISIYDEERGELNNEIAKPKNEHTLFVGKYRGSIAYLLLAKSFDINILKTFITRNNITDVVVYKTTSNNIDFLRKSLKESKWKLMDIKKQGIFDKIINDELTVKNDELTQEF